METDVISYRVADFLKQHAPFHVIAETDRLTLASRGRVRFFEPNEYLLWQGEPHRPQIFVIQQGTVSLWEELPEGAKLRDVRGAGDMLGTERYNAARSCLHSARSETDVVIYAFPASDFESFILKYPHAADYVAAESRVTPDYLPLGERPDLSRLFLHDVVRRKRLATCGADSSLSEAARLLLTTRSEALVVLDTEQRARGVLTADTFLRWMADHADAQSAVGTLLDNPPATVAPDVSVADGMLQMATTDVDALVITHDGTSAGRVQALVTRRDFGPLVGDDPPLLLREIRVATTPQELHDLNQRARAFVMEHLTGPSSAEWLARFTSSVDAAILIRHLDLQTAAQVPACWCFAGPSGRKELLTRAAPTLLAMFDDDVPAAVAEATFRRVLGGLEECGYLLRNDRPFEAGFYAASVTEWRTRYGGWVHDSIHQDTYRARSLFDLRWVSGLVQPWHDVETAITGPFDPAFIHLLANDCLDSLPPLTFFEDAVIDSLGEQTDTFRLDQTALRPLVDVARVFALAAGDALGRSTIERFAIARALLPAHEAIFREASDTLQIVLWQQARVGIGQGTTGSELPAARLSRHDRQVLKGAFRSILRLLEFTADRQWLKEL